MGKTNWGWDVAHQLVEHRAVTPLTQVRFLSAARDFSSQSQLSVQTFGIRTTPCAIACIIICVHDKDPLLHVRVRWIMATQTCPARTIAAK